MPGPHQAVVVNSFAEWRDAARGLLARGVPPHAVNWLASHETADLLTAALPDVMPAVRADASGTPRDTPHLPRRCLEMLQAAACFRAPDRWAFLYQIIWRWQAGQREVFSPADADGSRLHAMVKAVRREEHDMHAYVRFRERPQAAGDPRFIAWYEPAHDVLPQVATHFARRMGGVSWMIGTPDATVMGDGDGLHVTGPLLRGDADIEDAGEALWLTYYRSIFNPSRLNTRVMQSHVRERFWKNLPEGKLVPALVAEAASGSQRVGQAPAVGQRAGTVIAISPARAQPARLAPTSLDECRRCELWRQATQAVPGAGPGQAGIMLLGEQPGDQEDLAGQPFIGPAGQLLDEALARAALRRQDLYLTNAVKHFKWEPRGKRRLHKTPGQLEIMACRHWLDEELGRVRPAVVVTLGATALKAIAPGSDVNLSAQLGQPFCLDGRWIVPTWHPAYVLRLPDAAGKARAFAMLVESLTTASALLRQAGN